MPASLLGQLGRHFDAHQVYNSVLTARERGMGPDHPDTLRCRHNLAPGFHRRPGWPGDRARHRQLLQFGRLETHWKTFR